MEREIEQGVKKVVVSVAKKAAPALTAAGVTGTGAAIAVAQVLAAGLAGYLAGNFIILSGKGQAEKLNRLDQAYREARRALEAKLGHFPTAAEVKPITDEYNRQKNLIQANVPINPRAGVY